MDGFDRCLAQWSTGRHLARPRYDALPRQLNLFLEHNDLLELILDELLQLKDGLVLLIVSENDVQFGQRGLILIQLPLHEGVVPHERLRTSDLLHQQIVQA